MSNKQFLRVIKIIVLSTIGIYGCGPAELSESRPVSARPSNQEQGVSTPNNSTPNNEELSFENDLPKALGQLDGMWFACDHGDKEYGLLFYENTILVSDYKTGEETTGSYQATGDSLSLSLPEWGFSESATNDWVEMDVLVRFWTPSLDCYAVALDHRQPVDETVVTCPTVKYIPNTSWQDNNFHFGAGGDVKRRRWTEIVDTDTLYAERFGVYRQIGDKIVMIFAGAEEGEQVFIGDVIESNQLLIEQLEPEQGPCK